MDRNALANRFVNYADAASVFPLVQAVAFSVAMSEPDIRCSIAAIWSLIVLGNLVFAVIMTMGLFVFRRAELALRAEESLDQMVATYARRLQAGRYTLVWLSFSYFAFSAWSATLDPACAL